MSIIGSILKYFLYLQHLYQVIKLQRNRKKIECVYDDAQLKLYSQLLPKDFLHYGYFEDLNINPCDISITRLYKAQEDYGRLIVNRITDYNNSVLDIGCGMGGLSALMHSKNLNVVALTPDKNQIRHLKQKYKGLQVMDCRFEDMPAGDFTAHFGTAVTSESLQYLKLNEALPVIDKILKPGGKWVACDYFKKGQAGEKSEHNWRLFNTGLRQNGFKMTYQRDITPNVLPTIAYVYMWAGQIGMPIKEFALGKLKVKAPGIYYAMEEALPEIEKKINKNMDTINPATFAANKHYVLMVIERTG